MWHWRPETLEIAFISDVSVLNTSIEDNDIMFFVNLFIANNFLEYVCMQAKW
jgi:hypothetical protein